MQPLILLETYSYIGVFFLTLFGNIGLPVPEEVVFIMAGYLAAEGIVSFWGILAFSMFAILFTNNLSFFTGRFFGRRLFRFLCKFKSLKMFIEKTDHFFDIHGKKTIFLSRFIWNVRNWTPLLAGSSKMKWKDFQKYDFLGVLIYTPILVSLGYFFSELLDVVVGKVQLAKSIIFVFFMLLVGFYIFRKVYTKFFR